MARSELHELYEKLVVSQFSFLPKGEHHIDDIYRSVRSRHTGLCDDSYLCADNCSQGHQQPEWKHTVRKALFRLKSTQEVVLRGKGRGYWRFS